MKANQAFTYFYTKSVDNDLHKAAFRGNLTKVQEFLKTSISLYKHTKYHDTPLSLAICKGHKEVANILLNIYERDLKFIPNYLRDNQVVLKETIAYNRNYVLAIGTEQIKRVRVELNEFIGTIDQMDKEELKAKNCNVILLKENNVSEPEALFVFPRNRNDKMKLFAIACDLIEQNGVCGINSSCDSTSKTVMHLAAMHGATDIVMRLMDLGGDQHDKTIYGETPIGIAFYYSEMKTFIEMCQKSELDILKLNELLSVHHSCMAASESILLLIEHLVGERIKRFQESRDIALTNILSMNEVNHFFGYGEVGEKVFDEYGDYINQPEHLQKIMNGVLGFPNHNPETFLRILRKYENLFSNENMEWESIVFDLIRYGFTAEVKQIYELYPKCKEILFKTNDNGMFAIKSAIECNHVEMVNFLLDHHDDELKDARMWSRFLVPATNLPTESTQLFMRILDHPLSDPNMVVLYEGYENCLIGALLRKNFKNFELIAASGKIHDMTKIRTSYGETLVSTAIYAKRRNRIRYGTSYQSNLNDSRCLEDEETDEETSIEPRVVRSNGEKYSSSIDEKTESEHADKMNKIFERLVEMGADVFVENQNEGGLLHTAVAGNNLFVVEKLLNLGLDLHKPDNDGNRPVHFVRTCEMLNLLISKSTADILNHKNNNGDTVLHRLTRWERHNTTDLLNELLRHGVDVNETNVQGNSIFHFVSTAEFCECLLSHGGNPFLKNLEGETPLFRALSDYRPAVANILLRLPGVNLFDQTKDGTSYLHLMVGFHEDYFEEIKDAVDLHRNDFLKLCNIHCNDKTKDGSSILHKATTSHEYVASAVLAQPNLSIDNVSSSLNVYIKRPNIARLLIERGADVNKVNTYNEPLLIEAVIVQNVELVDVLTKSGVLINSKFQRDHENGTALHIACQHNNIAIIKQLLDAGADVDVINHEGKAPFDCLAPDYKCIFKDIWKE